MLHFPSVFLYYVSFCFVLLSIQDFVALSKMVIAIIKEQSLYICISQILFHLNHESLLTH